MACPGFGDFLPSTNLPSPLGKTEVVQEKSSGSRGAEELFGMGGGEVGGGKGRKEGLGAEKRFSQELSLIQRRD